MRHLFLRRHTGRAGLALIVAGALVSGLAGCVAPAMPATPAAPPVPASFASTTNAGRANATPVTALSWRRFFGDTTLIALIDTAIRNNPEMLSTLQEVEMARSEVQAVRGQLAPQVSVGASVGLDKTGRYTADGAGNASTDITDGAKVPEPLPDINLGFVAAWEVDIRGKIRSQKGAALARYLASVEGSRYVITGLIAEVANTYFELMALDAKLAIVRQAIELQRNELEVVRAQREAAAVSELAVQQFQALLLNAQSMEYELLQEVREAESRMNLLLGRYPQPVVRGSFAALGNLQPLMEGLPSQLLQNRPDIRQAELALQAARFDVKAARAEFFPEVNLAASLGLHAFKPDYLFKIPESVAYSLVGDLMAPLVNRTTIKAEFKRASAAQQQTLIAYRRSILSGVTEVSNLVSAVGNLDRVSAFKSQQAEAMERSVSIAADLFNAARANYLEVLSAQREAIDVKLELVETQLRQRVVMTNLYRALGGGWQ